MKLVEYKRTWSQLSNTEKLAIIETSNERRLRAFEIVLEKKEAKSTPRKSSGLPSKKKATGKLPQSPQELLALMATMSKEDRANFKLALQLGL